MDGFGDNFDQADVDPAAEFLAREKDQLAGLVDDVIPPASETGAGEDAPAGEHIKTVWKHNKNIPLETFKFMSNLEH